MDCERTQMLKMFITEYINVLKNAKFKVAVSVDKQRTLIRIYMEKY